MCGWIFTLVASAAVVYAALYFGLRRVFPKDAA